MPSHRARFARFKGDFIFEVLKPLKDEIVAYACCFFSPLPTSPGNGGGVAGCPRVRSLPASGEGWGGGWLWCRCGGKKGHFTFEGVKFHKCENASFWYDGVPAIVVVQRTCEATAGMPSHQKHAPRFKDDLAFEGLVTLN